MISLERPYVEYAGCAIICRAAARLHYNWLARQRGLDLPCNASLGVRWSTVSEVRLGAGEEEELNDWVKSPCRFYSV